MLERLLKGNVIFIGVGNPLKGDDGFGPRVAEAIPGAINAGTTPENFIAAIKRKNPDLVIIFDALDFGGRFGELKILEASGVKGIALSTHAIPLSKFAAMLFPVKVWLVGAQPKSAMFGRGMSEEVSETARRITDEVASWLHRHA